MHTTNERHRLKQLMASSPQIWTAHFILAGGFGKIILDDGKRCCLHIGDFYLLEGPFDSNAGAAILSKMEFPANIVSSNPEWLEWCKSSVYQAQITDRALYMRDQSAIAVKMPLLPDGFKCQPIRREDVEQSRHMSWCDNVFDSYLNTADYLERGFGFCIRENGRMVSLCCAFALSNNAAEIEIDTDPYYQGRGFAKTVALHFLKECEKRKLEPLWDASNLASEKLALSVGFKLEKRYKTCLITAK